MPKVLAFGGLQAASVEIASHGCQSTCRRGDMCTLFVNRMVHSFATPILPRLALYI